MTAYALHVQSVNREDNRVDRLDSTREELVEICANRTEQVRQVMADKTKLIELIRTLTLNDEDRRSVESVLAQMQ